MSTLLVWLVAAMTLLAPNRDHAKLAAATATVLVAEPPLFPGDDDRKQTAALVVAIMFRESSFRHGVISKTHDHCEMQIHRRADLDDDREKCVRVGLKMLRASIAACPSSPLAAYAGFSCSSAKGQWISQDRGGIAKRLLSEVTP